MQNLNILTVGAKDGKGGFFPEGIAGAIHTPVGFDQLADGTEEWDGKPQAKQVRPFYPFPHTGVCWASSCRVLEGDSLRGVLAVRQEQTNMAHSMLIACHLSVTCCCVT